MISLAQWRNEIDATFGTGFWTLDTENDKVWILATTLADKTVAWTCPECRYVSKPMSAVSSIAVDVSKHHH